MEWVTLVDRQGRHTGKSEKIAAHRDGGRLHLAFSILIFRPEGELLLQQRAPGKYHFASLWSNTCCGHPRPDETVDAAAHRRLEEEFGFTAGLHRAFAFTYQFTDEVSGLTEWEYLHVYIGQTEATPLPDPSEISAWRWVSLDLLKREMALTPKVFTPWFRSLVSRLDPALAAKSA